MRKACPGTFEDYINTIQHNTHVMLCIHIHTCTRYLEHVHEVALTAVFEYTMQPVNGLKQIEAHFTSTQCRSDSCPRLLDGAALLLIHAHTVILY
jgi:hypothetical protein